MTNLSAVLHNLLDAIEDGDPEEIRQAAKLAKMAAPTNDTEDTVVATGGATDWLWGLHDIETDTVVTGFSSRGVAEEAQSLFDDEGGNWYVLPNPNHSSMTVIDHHPLKPSLRAT